MRLTLIALCLIGPRESKNANNGGGTMRRIGKVLILALPTTSAVKPIAMDSGSGSSFVESTEAVRK